MLVDYSHYTFSGDSLWAASLLA